MSMRMLKRLWKYYQWLKEGEHTSVTEVGSPTWAVTYLKYVTAGSLAGLNLDKEMTKQEQAGMLNMVEGDLEDGLDVIREAKEWLATGREHNGS